MMANPRAQGVLVALLGLLLAPLPLLQAQKTAGGLTTIEPGEPPVVIHATVEGAQRAREAGGPLVSTANDLTYHGGIGGIGVETAPKIYLVLWGSQWKNDPSGESSLLQSFYNG